VKWGSRWGDAWGRVEAGSTGSLLSITALEAETSAGRGAYRLAWSWTGGGQKWGFRWGRRWGRAPVWFKVYVNGKLRGTTRESEYRFQLAEDEDPRVSVVVVGPENGDPEYDPSIEITAVPGNRVKLTWTPPTNSDLDHFHVYYDAGSGTVSYTTPLAEVDADGSASYSWTSAPLADGTYKFVVRSVDSAGNADTNTTTVSVTIASWPAAPTSLAYSYSAATKKVTLTWSGGATVNVYSNSGSGSISYAAAEASGVTSPWTSGVLTGAATFKYGVRADNGSYEETNLAWVEFELDASEVEVNRPVSPYGLTVTPAAAGTFTVAGWVDCRRPTVNGRTPPAIASVKIHTNAGSGSVDWTNALGTATLTRGEGGQYRFTYTTGAYADKLSVTFGARAYTSGSVADDNTDTASGTADATAPSAPTALAGSAVSATESDR